MVTAPNEVETAVRQFGQRVYAKAPSIPSFSAAGDKFVNFDVAVFEGFGKFHAADNIGSN